MKKLLNQYLPLGLSVVILATAGFFWMNVPAAHATFTEDKLITIDHTKVGNGAENETNFPVLVSTTTLASLKVTGSGGSVTSSSGYDIVFSSVAGCGSGLYSWEVERYVSTTGDLIAWVKIPTVSFTVDTTFHMCYGDSGTTTFQGGATGAAWDSNNKAVYHWPDGTTLSVADSSGNAHNGTNTGTVTTGEVDGGINFASGSSQFNNIGTVTTGANLTLSTWINQTSFPTSGNLMSIINDAYTTIGTTAVGHYLDLFNNSGTVTLRCGTYTNPGITHETNWAVSGWSTGVWHKVDCIYTGSAWKLYFDGSQVSTNTDAQGAGDQGQTYIGAISSDSVPARFINAKLDETRISGTGRSAGWVATAYNNENSPSTFAIIGSAPTPLAVAPTGKTTISGAVGAMRINGAAGAVKMQ